MNYPFICFECSKGLYFNEDEELKRAISSEFAEFLGNLCIHCYEKRGHKNLENKSWEGINDESLQEM